jgi:hypothetical protein
VADQDDDTMYDDVSAMADRLRLKGRERERYIHEHMTRSGYRAVPNYVLDEEGDEDEEGEGGFFGGGRRRPRERRDREGGRPRPSRRGSRDDDDWYS